MIKIYSACKHKAPNEHQQSTLANQSSSLCFALGCGVEKPLIMVFIYPPARLITPALVLLAALADAFETLWLSAAGGFTLHLSSHHITS